MRPRFKLALTTTFLGMVSTISVTQIVAYYITGLLPIEFLVSFTPYLIPVYLLMLAATLGIYRRTMSHEVFTKIVNMRHLEQFCRVTLVLILLCLTFTTAMLLNYSATRPEQSRGEEKNSQFKVAFFNKLYTNEDIDSIRARISELKPDILGIAEISEDDINSIASLYPYHHTTIKRDSPDSTGVAVFSKYPLNEYSDMPGHTLPYLSIVSEIEGKPIRLIVLHTTAPISQAYLERRNHQLAEIRTRLEYRRNAGEDFILMGDFNLSPWSASYREFSSGADWLINAGQGKGVNLTWNSPVGPGSQIDHIFHTDSLRSLDFHVDEKLGSDHNLIWTTITIQ